MPHSDPASESVAQHDDVDGASSLLAGQKRRFSNQDTINISDASNARRRITRACDQCNQLRTKCNGQQPCAHCVENQMQCDYARAHKKRGRVPKRDVRSNVPSKVVSGGSKSATTNNAASVNNPSSQTCGVDSKLGDNTMYLDSHKLAYGLRNSTTCQNSFNADGALAMHGHPGSESISSSTNHHGSLDFGLPASNSLAPDLNAFQGYGFPLGDDYSVAFMGKAPIVESPDWLNLASTMPLGEQFISPPKSLETLQYPVLLPLLPYIESVLSPSRACDLLEQYFQTSTYMYLRPKNPYVAGSMFRRNSILHPTDPRDCTPALLASILWISAQHSDARFLTSQPDARARICQKLLELTITMLKPLIHGQSTEVPEQSSRSLNAPIDTGLGALVFPYDLMNDPITSRMQLDNIVTYMHLATVVSASERKAASLRWWNAAWSLAREVRLSREIPADAAMEDAPSSLSQKNSPNGFDINSSAATTRDNHGKRGFTEEDREERRRVWWMLYMADRHLALCYNRPMFFLNQECETLLQPIDDEIWQSDHFEALAHTNRRRGLDIRCTSHSIFGCFLPLMIILGEIMDLNYARYRPRLGSRAIMPRDCASATDEIVQYLEEFEQSVLDFENEGPQTLMAYVSGKSSIGPPNTEDQSPPMSSGGSASKPYTLLDAQAQTDTVVAYARHIMHVLHILLTGKWDPVALLDDNDLWISSQSFVTATGHAVNAANELADIIEYDPDLSFMPYFFGIYLLQGSFLLLLFADKLQEGITSDVVKACETIVRAHEACVATLDTQYQRNFRKVMRSALQQLRGRVREDPTEQQNWRRDILKLYRWTGDGTGLAL